MTLDHDSILSAGDSPIGGRRKCLRKHITPFLEKSELDNQSMMMDSLYFSHYKWNCKNKHSKSNHKFKPNSNSNTTNLNSLVS